MPQPSGDDLEIFRTLIDQTRPIVDSAVEQYAVYLATFGGDDLKAMRAMIFWMENLQAVQGTTIQTYVAICAFMARRLQYHRPRLARSTMN